MGNQEPGEVRPAAGISERETEQQGWRAASGSETGRGRTALRPRGWTGDGGKAEGKEGGRGLVGQQINHAFDASAHAKDGQVSLACPSLHY